jgi:hypothetical protein
MRLFINLLLILGFVLMVVGAIVAALIGGCP